jgi:hypothetical protein
MNKSLIIHVVTETVLLLVVGVFMTRKINSVQTEVGALKQKIAEIEQQNQTLMRHIQQIYGILKSQQPSAQPIRRSQQQAYSTTNDRAMFDAEEDFLPSSPLQQPVQTPHPPPPAAAHQSQPISQAPNLMETVLNIFPSILPMMSGGGSSNNILAEINATRSKPESSPPDVEVLDDDPDVDEALNDSE